MPITALYTVSFEFIGDMHNFIRTAFDVIINIGALLIPTHRLYAVR